MRKAEQETLQVELKRRPLEVEMLKVEVTEKPRILLPQELEESGKSTRIIR